MDELIKHFNSEVSSLMDKIELQFVNKKIECKSELEIKRLKFLYNGMFGRELIELCYSYHTENKHNKEFLDYLHDSYVKARDEFNDRLLKLL